MESSREEKRMNVESDRLSSLPDDLLHNILSFNGLKHAIGTSVLSPRWRNIWTSMPCLDFSTEDFSSLPKFSEYVNNVMSHRNNQAEVFSLKLRFSGDIRQEFVEQVLNHAFFHGIQQLNVTFVVPIKCIIEIPMSLFNSQFLKHLTLKMEYLYGFDDRFICACDLSVSSNLDLPALATMNLRNINLYCDLNTEKSIGLFSNCPNLKNLTLNSCTILGWDVLSFCHPLLSNLTLERVNGTAKAVNVNAPQLKNLTIRDCIWDKHPYVISTPDLSSLIYSGYRPLRLFTGAFRYLEKVGLRVWHRDAEDAPEMFRLLQQLHSIKFLTLSLEILECLSSSMELISDQPSPFSNLKSLKIYPAFADVCDLPKEKLDTTEVINYLLDGSPSATFTMVTREEIIAKRKTGLAQKYTDHLRGWLRREKAEIETKMGDMGRGKTPIASDKTKIHEQHVTKLEYLKQMEETVIRINSCWEDLIGKGKPNISDVISNLQDIKQVLAKLSTANMGELQSCCSSVCSEGDTIVNKITDLVKTICDMKGIRFSDYIQ